MKFNRVIIMCAILTCSFVVSTSAQTTSPQKTLQERLEWFQDQKFGFMVHWGPYCQWGVVESWGLSLDLPSIRTENFLFNMDVYRSAYWKLIQSFYPMEFEPTEWAAAAKDAGMKYFIVTTKHHDGFNMFDTKWTDYKITGPDCPYSAHPTPDIIARLFDTFREEGFGIGAYYSKADWHSPFYWKPDTPAPDRNVNYRIAEEPERWGKFVEFVHGQIRELMTNYGRVDILWLDAGQVRAENRNMDIKIDKLAQMARSYQPWLIVVDRGRPNPFQDYRTPEQEIPDEPLDSPWETCMTMGDQWSFKLYDNYKSSEELIHNLVEIVSKGGNYLLNVGPMPNGKLPPPAVERMKEIGKWMKVNGEGIYGTRAVPPYAEGQIRLTKKGDYVYAFYLDKEECLCMCGDAQCEHCMHCAHHGLPESITMKCVQPVSGSEIYLMGSSAPLTWSRIGDGIRIEIPQSIAQDPPCEFAYAFKIKVAN